MQALSRNTSCVAQDFHNAGGEKLPKSITQQQQNKGVNSVSCNNRDINGTIGQQQQQQQQFEQQDKKLKAMSPIDHHHSPPATLELTTNSAKRRRKNYFFNDKENVNELLTKQLSFLKQQHQIFLQNLNASLLSDHERLQAIDEINEIFEGMYRNSLTIISSIEDEKDSKMPIKIKSEYDCFYSDENDENDDNDIENKVVVNDYTLPAFLRNNKEITVIMDTTKNRSKTRFEDNPSETRKNRKQLKPKKIEKENGTAKTDEDATNANNESKTSNINNLRDKHMLKLVTKKKCCYVCRNKSVDANSYYSKESLLLHNLWRHSPRKLECHRCEIKFNKIYKLELHKSLERH